MRIFRHERAEGADRGAAVAIGNFDGLHPGHQAVIAAAGREARAHGTPQAVLTFEPHPYAVFNPAAPPFRLTPFRSKARHIEALGVDLLFVLPFDLAFSKISADEFVRILIVEGLHARHAVVGYDFHFGYQRGGTPDVLRQLGARWGFGVTVVAPLEAAGGTVYSSTRIRQLLAAGQAHEAAILLGRPFEIESRVEMGDQRGRTIGFPTANMRLGDHLRPAGGVYAVRVEIEEETPQRWHDGVANLGTRPTVGGTDLRLEVHLFDFAGDLYGKHLRVALVEHLRPERKFSGLDELKAQIAADAAQARALLASEPAAH